MNRDIKLIVGGSTEPITRLSSEERQKFYMALGIRLLIIKYISANNAGNNAPFSQDWNAVDSVRA